MTSITGKFNRYLICMLLSFLSLEVVAQIPRMREEPWYKNKIEKLQGSNGISQGKHDADVLSAMREAYNAKKYAEVNSLYQKALLEVPGSGGIYNWERTALRELMRQEGVDKDNILKQLTQVYKDRRKIGLDDDQYQYGKSGQWNIWQQSIDYARYSRSLVEGTTRYWTLEQMIPQMSEIPDPYVLCEMMDISFYDNALSDKEFFARYEKLFSLANNTKSYLGTQYINLPADQINGAIQALDTRDMAWSNDKRIMNIVGNDYNLYVERFADNIQQNMNNESALKSRLIQMKPFKGKPLYDQVVNRICQIGTMESLMRASDDYRKANDNELAQRFAAAAESKIRGNDDRATYFVLMAKQHIEKKEFIKAVEMINKSLAITKDNPAAYLRLSECYTGNAQVACRVGNYLDKYASQLGMIAAMDMLIEKRNLVTNDTGKGAMNQQIEALRTAINRSPIQKADLFRVNMVYGDNVRLGSYIGRTITIRESY